MNEVFTFLLEVFMMFVKALGFIAFLTIFIFLSLAFIYRDMKDDGPNED